MSCLFMLWIPLKLCVLIYLYLPRNAIIQGVAKKTKVHFPPIEFRILGSCNGIICMIEDDQIYLYNPALQEFKQLPSCPFDLDVEHDSDAINGGGFGIDRGTNEYKVVLIRNSFNEYESEGGNVYAMEVQLYTTSSNSWKGIDYTGTTVEPWSSYPYTQVFFNGVCHWPVNVAEEDSSPTILCFKIDEEIFTHLEYSSDCVLKENRHLAILNECLTFIQHDGEGGIQDSYDIEVWVMKEYGVKSSWTKQFVVTTDVMMYPMHWNDDGFLLEDPCSNQLACVALNNNEVNNAGIYGEPGSFRAILYQESLISLNEVS